VRQIVQLVGKTDRLPETAQIFAAPGARVDMGEFGVLPGDVAMILAPYRVLRNGALVTMIVLLSTTSPSERLF
jgi:hypothetical protein